MTILDDTTRVGTYVTAALAAEYTITLELVPLEGARVGVLLEMHHANGDQVTMHADAGLTRGDLAGQAVVEETNRKVCHALADAVRRLFAQASGVLEAEGRA